MKQTLLAGGLDADTAAAMLDTAVAQAKADGTYQSAYSSAYQSAYTSAYNEAYNEAWAKIADEIDEKYADAEEKYDLNDPDFQAVPVTLYENFYRNEDEDHDNDGTSDGTIRVYTQTDDVNLACLIDGAFPVRDDEIAIDRMHADNVGLRTGDTITVGGKTVYDCTPEEFTAFVQPMLEAGVAVFGGCCGTTATLAMLNDAVKKGRRDGLEPRWRAFRRVHPCVRGRRHDQSRGARQPIH